MNTKLLNYVYTTKILEKGKKLNKRLSSVINHHGILLTLADAYNVCSHEKIDIYQNLKQDAYTLKQKLESNYGVSCVSLVKMGIMTYCKYCFTYLAVVKVVKDNKSMIYYLHATPTNYELIRVME